MPGEALDISVNTYSKPECRFFIQPCLNNSEDHTKMAPPHLSDQSYTPDHQATARVEIPAGS